MWHYSTASCHAYASIQPHSQSYNNIMLNSQYHSHFVKWKPSFLPTHSPPKPHTPTTLFSGAVKIKHFIMMPMCLIKCSFILFHFVSAGYRKFAFTSLPYINFTHYFKHPTARVFRTSYTCFQPMPLL